MLSSRECVDALMRRYIEKGEQAIKENPSLAEPYHTELQGDWVGGIPNKLKILGHSFDVILIDDNETDRFGSMNPNTNTIRLNKNKTQSQIETTLLHEIIEALDHNLEIKLEHRQISALEAGLYQVLKDNKLSF